MAVILVVDRNVLDLGLKKESAVGSALQNTVLVDYGLGLSVLS